MKIHPVTDRLKPHAVSAVTFDPWPFQAAHLNLTSDALYWDGESIRRRTCEIPWRLYEGGVDNTLVTFSDGSVVVCDEAQVAEVIAYVATHGLPG